MAIGRVRARGGARGPARGSGGGWWTPCGDPCQKRVWNGAGGGGAGVDVNRGGGRDGSGGRPGAGSGGMFGPGPGRLRGGVGAVVDDTAGRGRPSSTNFPTSGCDSRTFSVPRYDSVVSLRISAGMVWNGVVAVGVPRNVFGRAGRAVL